MTKLNRILFCTSPLQVINARSAMDYLGENNKYNDYVVITHPQLSKNVKKIIIKLSDKMKFKKVLDLSDMIKKNHHLSKLSFIQKVFNLKKIFVIRLNNFENCSNDISKLIHKEIGSSISTIFFRVNYSRHDTLYINCFENSDKYGIEDGFADYIPNNWPIKHFNFHEMKHWVKAKLFSSIYFLIGISLTRRFLLCKKYFLQSQYNLLDRFTNVPTSYSICVATFFKNNIRNLSNFSSEIKDFKVVIVGTLLDDRFKYSVDDEINIYNKLILQIIKKYKIQNNEIWYKPHPRIDYKSWLKKKNNLECSVFDHKDEQIIDINLYNKGMKAVYSVASTSLLYAKKIFNIDSYWVDIRSEKVHPSGFEKAYYLSKKYNIESIIIN